MKNWPTIRRFLPDVAPFRGAIALAIGLHLMAIGLELARPWALQQIFDRALVERSPDAKSVVIWGSAFLLFAVLARVALQHVATLRLIGTGHALTRALRLRVFRQMVELPPTFHAHQKSGDLLMRLMGDAPMVSTMLVDASSQLITRAIQVTATIALMLWVDAGLTLTLAFFLPVIFVVARFLAGRLTIATRKQRRKEGDMADFMQEALGATAVIQSLGHEGETVRAFAKTNRRNARAGLKTARAAMRLSSSVEGLLGVALGITVLLGALRVLQSGSGFSAGELLVFLSYVRGLMKPLRSAAKHQARVAKGVACGERLAKVLDEDRPVRSTAGTLRPPAKPTSLAFEDVTYAYPAADSALKGASFKLHAGELIAVAGKSGAGKSTIAALLLRLMDPQRGRITLDDVRLPDYDLDRLRGVFALSMQSTVLFGATVAENLRIGAPEASDAELWIALENSGGAEVVRSLAGGLGSRLGSAGSTLSGGERKRICLARAFLRDAPILIADEPFNGLDTDAALRVEATLRERARSGGIVVVITHDLRSLGRFDRVLFLSGKRLRTDRSDSENRVSDPEYARLVDAVQETVG